SLSKLEMAARFLGRYPNVRILVEGHCDERGSSEYNMGLGENRGRAVKNYLNNYGIQSMRVEVTSWGKERPVNRGCTDEECHAKNRRAVYKVLSK
ncbi:MAG: OmpA family protein, partial [Chitinivibrionales bacterium]|nr:OmpA family protein [Chitinivibrionales bacterium]